MTKKKKNFLSEPSEVQKSKLSPEEEEALILAQTLSYVYNQGSDDELDKNLERNLLTEYRKYNPKYNRILGDANPYRVKYPNEYYVKLARVLGIPVSEEDEIKMRFKPPIMSRITLSIIYERFGPGFIAEIQRRNCKNEEGQRMFYHHQLLKPEAEGELIIFIKDAIAVMGECQGRGLYYFIQRLRRKLGKDWQSSLFDNE